MDIDDVFWIQVKESWSEQCDVKLAGEDKIKQDSGSPEQVDEAMDYGLIG